MKENERDPVIWADRLANLDAVLEPWDVRLSQSDVRPAELRAGTADTRVVFQKKEFRYRGQWISRPTIGGIAGLVGELGGARSRADGRRLILADRVSEQVGAELRRLRIDYIDRAGNIELRLGSSVIAVRTQTRPPSLPVEPDAAVNLFSPARAQISAVLLQWPKLVEMPIREVARCAGVSDGLVHSTMQELKKRGFLFATSMRSSVLRLVEVDDLVAGWTGAYPTTLRPKLLLGSFHSDLTSWRKLEVDEEVLIGGEFSVDDTLVPATVTIYAPSVRVDLMRRHRMVPRPHETNTDVLRSFWVDPRFSPERRVPWVLDYAELMSRPDSRVRQAAEEFRDRASR